MPEAVAAASRLPRSPTRTTRPAAGFRAALSATSGPIPAGQPVLTTTSSLRARPSFLAFELFGFLVFVIGRSQLVARAPERFQGQCIAQFGPQAPHVNVDRARSAVVAIAPNPREQVIPREHLATAFAQVRQERELLGRQVDRAAADGDLVSRLVHHDRPHLVPLLGGKLAASPFERADPA